ncbi:hypothetical protein SIAM614_10133 [Stappia aggregata IAM 12614]|uniref:Uncharacterized protein n=1 Tax=Roseibium aggregatum (strain ATCC 25650 / DSM 13394 / JCM 20685 / NBRC 16684 / NCIMB 2208 / IAM 12614 / B1) TaxID=384765 RepID=A0NM84_ROSAI|nr:hypothetical protein [Roseibium aggregatum]EAV46179.1 hypothetical protein SIAM614_10133 [Stappia aggregata IAM 12614] [Roseibium aggregatum IAM 12614]
MLKRYALPAVLAGIISIGAFPPAAPQKAWAEIFYCESTRTPNGSEPYCNFLLFDKAFTRHMQVIVAQGARRDIDVNGRYDVFCVLVQNHRNVPDNFAYRKQQSKTTDTGREYKVPIRAINLRRGRDGFSSNNVQSLLPKERW